MILIGNLQALINVTVHSECINLNRPRKWYESPSKPRYHVSWSQWVRKEICKMGQGPTIVECALWFWRTVHGSSDKWYTRESCCVFSWLGWDLEVRINDWHLASYSFGGTHSFRLCQLYTELSFHVCTMCTCIQRHTCLQIHVLAKSQYLYNIYI